MAGGRFFVAVASFLVSSRIVYEVVCTGKYHRYCENHIDLWEIRLALCMRRQQNNGGTRMTGPQQTTDRSLIIL